MGLRPILSALLRNRAGALLVAIQIALTLAIVVNAVYVTEQRVSKIGRPSGLDDQNQFALSATGFEKNFDFFGMVRADLALLRALPGVVDATSINQIPLSGGGSSTQFFSLPDKKGENSPVAYYDVDDHAVQSLGVKLASGKNFAASEVEFRDKQVQGFPATAIVTRAFADALFPKQGDNLVGKTFYDDQSKPLRIVGVIDQMQGAWVGWDKVDRVMLSPMIGPGPGTRYLVRTQPGALASVMAATEVALRKRDPNRVIGKLRTVQNFKQNSYAGDSLMAVTLSVVTGLERAEHEHAADRHTPRRGRAQARHRELLPRRELDGHDVRRSPRLRTGAGRRLLAVDAVRPAAPRSLLPRGRRGRTLGRRSARGVAARTARGEGLACDGHSQCLSSKDVCRLQPFRILWRLTHDGSDFKHRGPPGTPDHTGC